MNVTLHADLPTPRGTRLAALAAGFLCWAAAISPAVAQIKTYPPGTPEPVEPPRPIADAPRPPEPDRRSGEAAPGGEVRVLRTRGEGVTRDEALRQALRNAVEQGAGVEIASHSRSENFVLVRDTVYARSAGVSREYRVLREEPGRGWVTLEIEAQVRPDAVAATWGEVQHVLDQIGRPKIMVCIEETIDGQVQAESVVAARIEEMLAKSGFDLVERRAAAELAQRETRDASAERNDARLAMLAKDAGAHLLIRGSANATRAGMEVIYNVPVAFYNCDVQAKVYYTDTARLLASESIANTRAGVRSQREFSPQAARTALTAATFPEPRRGGPDAGRDAPDERRGLAERLYDAILEQWSTKISSAADIELEVENLSFRSFVGIKRALAEIDPRIRSVDGDFSKGIVKLRIKAQMPAAALAERLVDPPFREWLEVVDLKLNRIQAKGVERP